VLAPPCAGPTLRPAVCAEASAPRRKGTCRHEQGRLGIATRRVCAGKTFTRPRAYPRRRHLPSHESTRGYKILPVSAPDGYPRVSGIPATRLTSTRAPAVAGVSPRWRLGSSLLWPPPPPCRSQRRRPLLVVVGGPVGLHAGNTARSTRASFFSRRALGYASGLRVAGQGGTVRRSVVPAQRRACGFPLP
jgi:hypothetical protein